MNAYAPTEESDDVDKDRFYQTVERAYDPISNNDIKMVIEDLNAKLGREDVYKRVIGNTAYIWKPTIMDRELLIS
jgi:hypothetical protein